MAASEIRIKIQNAISEPIREENQVVFILSRVRKMLESEELKPAFSRLVFYCDWVLHAKLSRVQGDALQMLKEFVNGNQEDFLNFAIFTSELKRFFAHFDIKEQHFFESDNYARFISLLVDIYTDTPVIVTVDEQRTINFYRVENKGVLSVGYSVV